MRRLRSNRPAKPLYLALVILAIGAGSHGQAASSTAGSQAIEENFQASYEAALNQFRAVLDFRPGGHGQAEQPGLTEPVQAEPSPVEPPDPTVDGQPSYGVADLIQAARDNNPAIHAAYQAVLAAAADLRGARARRLPTATVESSASFIGNPIGPISVRAGQFGSIGDVAIPPQDSLLYKGQESSYYQFSLKSFLPLYTWGKLRTGITAAEQGLEIAQLQYQKAIHETELQIRGTMAALANLRQASLVGRLNQRVGQRLTALAEGSAAAGFLTASELYSARIRLKEVDLGLASLEEQSQRLLADLSRLSGLPLDLANLRLEAGPAGAPASTEAESLARILAGNHDLKSLRAMIGVRASLAELAGKQASGRPDLGLQLELSYAGPRFPFLETDWYRQNDYQFTLSLATSGNLFGSRSGAGEAARAEAEYQESLQRSLEAERSVGSFVRESYLRLELEKVRLEFAMMQQEAWQAQLRQERLVLAAGGGDEAAYLTTMMEALGKLTAAWGNLAEYQAKLLALEGAAGVY